MEREQTTRWLYFCTLYYTGNWLIFIDWICGAEPTGSVAVPVSKYVE